MKLDPLKITNKIANFIKNPSLASAESFVDVDNKLIELETKLEEISTSIQNIEIPEQKDHTDHMNKMMEMISEPITVTIDLNII